MRTETRLNHNQQGFSVIELLVVMGITVVLMGAAMYTFTKQEKVIRTEQSAAQIRAMGRNGINELAKELRRAGYGMPRGHGIYYATNTSIYWWSNPENATTNVTSDVAGDDNSIDVQDGTVLATGPNGIGYLILRNVKKQDNWNILFFSSVGGGGTKINLPSGYYPDQVYAATTETVQVSKLHYQRLTYNASNKVIQFYDDAHPVVPLVSKVKSVTYTYFDGSGNAITSTPLLNNGTSSGGWRSGALNAVGTDDIHNIRRIGITLVMEDPKDFAKDITLQTDVNLRNMES